MIYDEAARIEYDKVIGPHIHIFEYAISKKAGFDVRVAWERDDGQRDVISLGVRDTVGDAIALLRQFQGIAIDPTVKFAVRPFSVRDELVDQVRAETAEVLGEVRYDGESKTPPPEDLEEFRDTACDDRRPHTCGFCLHWRGWGRKSGCVHPDTEGWEREKIEAQVVLGSAGNCAGYEDPYEPRHPDQKTKSIDGGRGQVHADQKGKSPLV